MNEHTTRERPPFPSIEEVHEMLDEIAEALPEEIYRELNGGIILLPQAKLHPESDPRQLLYILGEYSVSRAGRQVILYYGSFRNTWPRAPRRVLYRQLEKTLHHELTHHLEGLAGEYDLEIEDARNLWQYRNRLRR